MRKNKDLTGLLSQQFRDMRNQMEKNIIDKQRLPKKGFKKDTQPKMSDTYINYKRKAENLQENIDKFNVRDLVYHFRELANQEGRKYVISNFAKEMAIIKRSLKNYEPKEIVLMMEFLFNSNQDYLDKSELSITILSSGYSNTIFKDSLLWANDQYMPRSTKKHSKREYNKVINDVDESNTSIGDWEEI